MLESTDCSTLEEVAAFAEGRLRGAERERLIAHLAGCADCREVLAETVETAEELEAAERPAKIAHCGRAQRPPRAIPLGEAPGAAAATIAVVGAVVVSQLKATRSPPSPDEWLAEMPAAASLAPHVWGGVRMRGGDDPGEMFQQSTELGALLVDVRVTNAAGDVKTGSEVLTRMAAIVEDAGFMGEDDVLDVAGHCRRDRRRAPQDFARREAAGDRGAHA